MLVYVLSHVSRPPQFSMLHAAAITGDKSGLQRLVAGNFCDIDLRDKVSVYSKLLLKTDFARK